MAPDTSIDLVVQECLGKLGISTLEQWDVLVFLHRHHVTLASPEHVSRLLGYPCGVVREALNTLQSLGLVQCSTNSQNVHLYQLARSEALPLSCFEALMTLAEDRKGRLLLAKKLGRRTNPHPEQQRKS